MIKCKDCYFVVKKRWENHDNGESGYHYECHRYAKLPSHQSIFWPSVSPDDCCGEGELSMKVVPGDSAYLTGPK